MSKPISYKSSAYYFRAALRNARTKRAAVEVGLHAIAELEALKAWVRAQGMIPPKFMITQAEQISKSPAVQSVIPFPSKAVESETAG